MNNTIKFLQTLCFQTQKSFVRSFKRLWNLVREHWLVFVISMMICALLMGMGYQYKKYQETLVIVEKQTVSMLKQWKEKDKEKLAKTFQVDQDYFTVDTGLKYESVNQLFDDTTFNSDLEYTIKDIQIKKIGKTVTAKVRFIIKTYDNMDIMNTLLENIVGDKSQITYKYSENDFINKHVKTIKKQLEDFKGSYTDLATLTLHYNKENKKWEMKLEGNEEVINGLSGNMYAYMKTLQEKEASQ